MADKTCPKCNIHYSDPKVVSCLLCGTVLVVRQPVGIEAKVEEKLKGKKLRKPKMVESNTPQAVQTNRSVERTPIICEVTEGSEVPPFDDTGGFSKRNNKKELQIEQLRADNEALRKRQADLENICREQHPEPKSWYGDIGKWLTLLLVLGMIYLIYWFVESQGGLPHEFYNLLRRIGL